eukprot:1014321_1
MINNEDHLTFAPPADNAQDRVEFGLHADYHSVNPKLHVLMDRYPESSFCIALVLFLLSGVIVLILTTTGNLIDGNVPIMNNKKHNHHERRHKVPHVMQRMVLGCKRSMDLGPFS